MPDQSTFLQRAVGMFRSTNAHGGVTQLSSSFGPDNTTTGPEDVESAPRPSQGKDIDPRALYFSERSKELEFRQRYFTGRQHNDRPYNARGQYRGTNVEAWSTQPLMSSSPPDFYVPLEARRPGSPKRIGRTMVRRFTAMLFSSHRFPQLRSHDADTQDYAQEISRVACLQQRMTEVRNIAGCCGTGAVSWCFFDGKPIARTHLGRYVHVLEWQDFDSKDVAHAIELYIIPVMLPDENGVPKAVDHWYRRDWTLDEDIVFQLHPVLKDGEAYSWQRDENACHRHGDGFPHFEWMVNDADLEPDCVDGQPDYAEQYEAMDSLDITFSVVISGTQKNLDPTLVVKGNKDGIDGLMKGSDNAIFLGDEVTNPGGSAEYLEINGTSVTAGLALFKEQRAQILEDAQCVIADPNEIAAAGTSGAAIELLYLPMVSVSDDRRGTFGPGYVRLVDRMVQSARRLLNPESALPDYDVDPEGIEDPSAVANDVEADPAIVGGGVPSDANPGLRAVPDLPADEAAPEEEPEVEYFLKLEPRVVEKTLPDGRVEKTFVERTPGSGTLSLEWGQYFPPTVADKTAAATGLGAANGAKPSLSQKTSVEAMAALYDLDPAEEWQRVQDEAKQARDRELGMSPGIGGDDLLPGAQGAPAPDPSVPPSDVTEPVSVDPGATAGHTILDPTSSAVDPNASLLTDTDMAIVVTVNEARLRGGLGILMTPQGQPDPDGNLTVAEFKAKREAKGETEGEAQGDRNSGIDPNAKNAPPPPNPNAPPKPPPFGR